MSQYLLSTYAVEGGVEGAPSSPEEMQQFMQRVMELEAEMDESNTFLFGGGLTGPDAATVVRPSAEGPLIEVCLHPGGHNMRPEWVARAWRELSKARGWKS